MSNLTTDIITKVVAFNDTENLSSKYENDFLVVDLERNNIISSTQSIAHSLEENRLLLTISERPVVVDEVSTKDPSNKASSIALESIRNTMLHFNNKIQGSSRLQCALEVANDLLWSKGRSNPESRTMEATVVTAFIDKEFAHIAQVGEYVSCYIIRSNRIKFVTSESTFAPRFPVLSEFEYGLGRYEYVQVNITSFELKANDILVLCSSNITRRFREEEILYTINTGSSLEESAKHLIELANRGLQTKNTAIILAKFEGTALKTTPPPSPFLSNQIKVLGRFDPEQPCEKRSDFEKKGNE